MPVKAKLLIPRRTITRKSSMGELYAYAEELDILKTYIQGQRYN